MIEKKQMTEEEIKLNYITPAITATWAKASIRMEYPVTLGRIIIDGKKRIVIKRGLLIMYYFTTIQAHGFP